MWVAATLLSDLVFAGHVHLTWHRTLRKALSGLAIVAGLAPTLATAPAYFNYGLYRGVGGPKPAGWPLPLPATSSDTARLSLAAPPPPPPLTMPVTTQAHTSRGHSLPAAPRLSSKAGRKGKRDALTTATLPAAAALKAAPWVFRNPDAPRTTDCSYCGPGLSHQLRFCSQYTAYLSDPSVPKIPVGPDFPIGTSLRAALSSPKPLNGSRRAL